ncbi:MAG: HDIG domain-containing protein [Treponema sp.]|jgi:putative nucleotidyltransferase with HDIG domain|nr:HDIG domain-containing protein [Treponema sp.]
MMTRKFNLFIRDIRNSLGGVFNLTRSHIAPGLVSLCSFLISVLVVLGNMGGGAGMGDIRDFETGKVADRDVIAGYPVSYIDEEATRIRMENQDRLVPAVFRHSREAEMEARDSWNAFCDFADKLAENSAAAPFRLAIQAKYPAFFSNETIAAYVAAPERAAFRGFGLEALDAVLTRGVFSLDSAEIKNYSSDAVELLNPSGSGTGWEQMPYSSIVTADTVREALEQTVKNADMPVSFRTIGADLLRPFIKENVFFSLADSHRRIAEARERVAPVIKYIKKGMKIIRKGFVITADEMQGLQALQALYLSNSEKDPRNVIGLVLLISLVYVLFIFLRGRLVLGRELNDSESYLLSALACLYLTGAVLIKNISPGGIEGFPAAIVFPTALLVMIPAVFMGARLALVIALAFPLGAYLSGSFDTASYIFALISGVAASTVLKDAEKRMDLIKAGLIIAAANCLAVIVILLMRGASPADYPVMLFWAALNGIISGMLVLGVLPPLENVLNAVTPFRLMELSDLNAPILRKLFTTAPGTYSHSIMVANLAEQACQDIGADPLLARVGAYYHDIGKMENPGYFVENQTDHNKHDDIAPRLSATVIRSHVKLGVEKARSLGLPKDVISIIAEHHGNSLISWFYNKAVQKEDQVNAEDFSYPGTPPRSRESAVVMLADVTEAAVRTLSKPTAAKMEKFIQRLFSAKVEHGQLAESELTFRDLETIKNAFVRVLAGYYHSRIEYPDQKKERNGKESREEEK